MAYNGIVQASLLGRFGNMLFEYAAARAYAQRIGAKFECPDWVGRKLFQLDDAFPSCELPDVNGDAEDFTWGQTNLRLGGYHQIQRWADIMRRGELQRWFCFRRPWHDTSRAFYIAAHLRRGDYVGHPCYCTVSKASYLRACEQYSLPQPHVWISDEAGRKATVGPGEYEEYAQDFATLMHANVILRANSSFSWWAAALSRADVFSPVVEARVGEHDVAFVPGNWPRCADSTRVGVPITDLHLPE